MRGKIAKALSALTPEQLGRIKPFLVEPRCEVRPWSYGPEQHACWIVLEHQSSGTAIAYCETGFGPTAPWGLLWIYEPQNIGQDSSWFPTLWEAFEDSWAGQGEDYPAARPKPP
jgi:hypothetical protein